MTFLVGNPSRIERDNTCKGCEIMKYRSGEILPTVRLRGGNSKTLWTVDRGSVGNLSRLFDQIVGDNIDTSPKSYFDRMEL
jgi:hypothetical protein